MWTGVAAIVSDAIWLDSAGLRADCRGWEAKGRGLASRPRPSPAPVSSDGFSRACFVLITQGESPRAEAATCTSPVVLLQCILAHVSSFVHFKCSKVNVFFFA